MSNSENTQSESFFNVDWDAEFNEELSEKEIEILSKIAKRIVELGLVAPAIMFLEPMRPLNYLSSQALLFLEPFTAHVLGFGDMIHFRRALSKRESVSVLIEEIERFDAGVKPEGPPVLKKLTMDVGDLFKKRFSKIKNK